MSEKIYLAGPITSEPNYRENFADGVEELRKFSKGCKVVNPAEFFEGPAWKIAFRVFGKKFFYPYILRRCIGKLSRCDSIALLPGWSESPGAIAEYFFAYACEYDSIYLAGSERLDEDGYKIDSFLN